MPLIKNSKGFTLLEMVMVIILLGIIMAVSSKILSTGLSAFFTGQNVVDATWQGQFAMERMIRDIRLVRTYQDVVTHTANEMQFTDMNGNSIDYKLTGTSLMRNTQILADGISALSFTYLDSTGATALADMSNLHFVTITLNITQNNANYSLTSAIYLRELI